MAKQILKEIIPEIIKIESEEELLNRLNKKEMPVYTLDQGEIYIFDEKSVLKFEKKENEECKNCKFFVVCLNIQKLFNNEKIFVYYNVECDLLKKTK